MTLTFITIITHLDLGYFFFFLDNKRRAYEHSILSIYDFVIKSFGEEVKFDLKFIYIYIFLNIFDTRVAQLKSMWPPT